MNAVRSYGIVPAAGLSVRMGAPKLLLPLAGRTLIEQSLSAWHASRVARVVVVVRAHETTPLLELCRESAVDVVAAAEAPPDMKASAQLAIQHIDSRYSPRPNDAWLLAPADIPWLSSRAIDALIANYDPKRPSAVALSFRGKRGHPTLFPWSCVGQLSRLGANEGINVLLQKLPVSEVLWHDETILRDVDTPSDYEANFSLLNSV